MKLLIITPGRLPIPAVQGGAVETLVDLLLNYNEVELKNEIYVVTTYDEKAEQISHKYQYTHFYYIEMGCIWNYLIKKHWIPYRAADTIFSIGAVQRQKNCSIQFDCVVIENELVNGRIWKRFFERSGRKGRFFYHAHNDDRRKEKKQNKRFLKECRGVITVSRYLETDLRDTCGLGNTKTIYNGIDANLFCRKKTGGNREKLREKYGISKQECVIVFAGRLVPEKGIELLIRAWQSIAWNRRIKLLILGSSFFKDSNNTGFEAKLKSLCENYKDSIIFSGYIPHQEMPDFYSMADIGCIPSLWEEPFGLSCIEQMAMELPVIATDSGALTELVDSSCGIVLRRDMHLSETMAKAILELSSDPQKRRKMGEAGRKKVLKHFDGRKFCDQWFRYLEEAGSA